MPNYRSDNAPTNWDALERLPKEIREHLYASPFRWRSDQVLQGYQTLYAANRKTAIERTIAWIKQQEEVRLREESTTMWEGLPLIKPMTSTGPPKKLSRKAGRG
jgi:hypothetical protein